MTLKELKQKGYKTISSLRKINNSIRVEKIPDCLKQNGIKFGNATYYPKETIDKVLDYFFNTPQLEKSKIINKQRYGIENPFQLTEKIKQSMLKKYGVEHPTQLKEIKDKIKNTVLQRYGETSVMHVKEFKEKAKINNILNHNGVYNSQTKEYLEKRSQTWLNKYGVDNISKLGMNQAHKIEFDGIYFDSKWELYYYFYLKNNNINFEYHPKIMLEYEFEGKSHRYLPDFKVEDRLVEIKGDHFFDKDGNLINPFKDDNGKSKCKQECMIKNNVLVLTDQDIKPFKQYFLAHQPS